MIRASKIWLVAIAIVASACSEQRGTPVGAQPTPAAPGAPQAPQPEASPAPEQPVMPTESATPVPTPTPAPAPTASPEPTATPAPTATPTNGDHPRAPLEGPVGLLVTPSTLGHPEFHDAVVSAHTSVEMVMYHMSDQQIVTDLGSAAGRGVRVRVILDGKSITPGSSYEKTVATLRSQGCEVKASSTAFSITHEKAIVIDHARALITAINLTKNFDKTRDFGISTVDPGVIKEMTAVFEADWQNADTGASTTPPLADSHLVWSPVNSFDRIKAVIDGAKSELELTTENLGERKIMASIAEATKRGVNVRVIVPECDQNFDPQLNIPLVNELVSAGVNARVMPPPATFVQPYMHSKMIVADGRTVYVGSVNLSNNSLHSARELGIILDDSELSKAVSEIFEHDWMLSIVPPLARTPGLCAHL